MTKTFTWCCFWAFLPSLLFSASLRPLPWLTEGAITFLTRYFEEHPDAKVLEFGSGASTVWMAKRTKNLVSVDHNPYWNSLVKQRCLALGYSGVQLSLRSLPYYGICEEFPEEAFDLILIDGRDRVGCITHAIPRLKQGGVLMLDNAERRAYRAGTSLLKDWASFSDTQKKPDACGFCYRGWTTSWWIKPLKKSE